uniref:Ycf2 n=1 Tax=Jubula hutchinsiae TaxID=203687 RepID=A0A4Y5P657_9MARC|nr:Ycf2 [Jubula hutchinsiae]QCW58748.1 Ycf2 [Jubula hutchinsiae]
MKQKLPEKKSLYKNLYLSELQKTEILSKNLTKFSLIKLLITKFINTKNLIKSFDFRIFILLGNSSNSRNNKIFVRDTLMLVALLVFILIYRSNCINIVEQNNFNLTKIQKQGYRRKNHMGIYTKFFRNLNKNFGKFPYNFFILDVKKQSKNDFMDIIPVFFKKILLETDNLFEKEKYESIYHLYFSKNFFNLYIFAKEIINKDSWLRKKIFQNLQNWGESDQIIVKSSFLSKEKPFANYMKYELWQFSKKNLDDFKQVKEKIFKSSYNELNNPKLLIIVENILTNSIYKFSRDLSYQARKVSDNRIRNSDFFIKKMSNNIHFVNSNYIYIGEKVKKYIDFIYYLNFDQYPYWNINKNNTGMKKFIFRIGNKLLEKPIFVQKISSTSFFRFLKKKKTDFLNKTKITNKNSLYIIKKLFLQKKTKRIKLQKYITNNFLEKFLIEDFDEIKTFSKISINIERIWSLKNNIETDDIEIISLKMKKYHYNFLTKNFLPFNLTYNIIRQNYLINEEFKIYQKEWNRLFLKKFFHFSLPILSNFKSFFLFVNRIKLKKLLIEKNNQLKLSINQPEYSNFINRLLLLTLNLKNNNDKIKRHESLKNILLSKDTIQTTKILKFYNFKNRLENSYKKIYKIHRYLMPYKNFFKKNFIWTIQAIKYENFVLQVYKKFYEINNLNFIYFSKKRILDPSLLKIQLSKISRIFFININLEYIDKIENNLQIIFTNSNKDIEQVQIINKNEKSFINQILLKNNNFNEIIRNDFIINSLILENKNEIYRKLFNKFIYLKKMFELIKKKPYYNQRFLFFWKKLNIEKNLVYSQFLQNFSKYNKINPNFLKINSLFFREKIISLARLQLNNLLLSKMSYENYDKTKLNSFSYFYKKYSNENNFYSSVNSEINFAKQKVKVFYYNFFMKNLFGDIDSKKTVRIYSIPELEKPTIENFYNILYCESLKKNKKRNNQIFHSINNIYIYTRLNYSKLKNLKYKTGNQLDKNTDKSYKYNQYKVYNFLENYTSFKTYNYILWFFTSEWWEYNFHLFLETVKKIFLIIDYHIEYFIDNYTEITKKNLTSLWKKRKNLYNLNLKKSLSFFIDYGEILSNSVWLDFQLLNNWKNLNWIIFSLIVFMYLSYQNYFAILIGSESIDLWKHFETIKYLTDTSRAFYFTKLMHGNNTQLNKTENLVIYLFTNLKYYARNIKFFFLTKKKLRKWLINNKSLDLSRRKRNVLVQSLITYTRIKEYGFEPYTKQKLLNNKFDYWGDKQQGFLYLRYLIGIFRKNLVNYPLFLADKWIFFASIQKIFSSHTLQQKKRVNLKFNKIPTPLQFGLSSSKGILLIGPIETGRSYLIKNLAADSCVPLLGIYTNKLLYNKPDVITESWMNILIESLRRLNLTLDLAKGMSPCIIWIRNIHQLDVNRSTENIESDPTFLLGILLKHFQMNSTKIKTKNNIIVIGSTNDPKKVDPSLISPDRLDRIINIRLFNMSQRKNQFPILLNKKNIKLRKNLLYFDFEARTMGYNMRDLATLTNEISLISLTKNESFIYPDTIKLAFHRQIFGFTHTKNKPNLQKNFKIILYKIGRAIIQNILIDSSPTNPLNISYYLWKRKFYYLSKWYSEPSINQSTIKESTIIVHILGCLAGIAARDSWFLLERNSDNFISLDKSIENDLDLASSILESFSIEFPWLETCKIQFLNYKQKKPKMFSTTNVLSIMQNGMFAITNKSSFYNDNDSKISQQKNINRRSSEFKETAWSPRFWRLNFSRSNLFNWIKRPNDFEFSRETNFDKKNYYKQLINKEKEQLVYERILPRVRKRNVRELEEQFEKILLEEQFEILGSFCPSTYQMEHQLGNKSRLFIGKRILWDPTGSFSRIWHFVFSRRDFFVDEEMLRRLYITYGVRRERERSFSSQRIKRFFIYRGYDKDLINKLSIRWWNQLPIDQKHNIYTLKRIENIGIQLKRPQIFTPVYLYQRWLIENIPEKFSRLKFLTHRDRWLKINNLLLNDSFSYTTLLESYQYLFEFFLSNKILLNRMIKILVKKKWLFHNEIRDIIRDIKVI